MKIYRRQKSRKIIQNSMKWKLNEKKRQMFQLRKLATNSLERNSNARNLYSRKVC